MTNEKKVLVIYFKEIKKAEIKEFFQDSYGILKILTEFLNFEKFRQDKPDDFGNNSEFFRDSFGAVCFSDKGAKYLVFFLLSFPQNERKIY